MYDASNAGNTPHYPGKIWMKSSQQNISGVWVEDTPQNRAAVQRIELQASLGIHAKGDHATAEDFKRESPHDRSYAAFDRWYHAHGMSTQHSMTLQQQLFPNDIEATTFHPQPTMADSMPAHPLKRKAKPMLATEALDSMNVSGGSTLEQLQEAGIVAADMSEVEFDSRLKRLKMAPEDRMRLSAHAYEAGWFGAACSAPSKANGDTWGPHAERPLTVPGVVNLDGKGGKGVWLSEKELAQLKQDVQAGLALVEQWKARRQEEARRRELQGKV